MFGKPFKYGGVSMQVFEEGNPAPHLQISKGWIRILNGDTGRSNKRKRFRGVRASYAVCASN